jgi:glutaredoxin 3
LIAKIEVYSGNFCPHCIQAKSLLKRRGLDYVEYNVQAQPEKRQEMLERTSGARTIPQIFINGRHVGGSDELHALDRKGELNQWLEE